MKEKNKARRERGEGKIRKEKEGKWTIRERESEKGGGREKMDVCLFASVAGH